MQPPAGDIRRLSERRLAWLFVAAVVIFGTGVGLRDPWPADEPRFVLNALEMIETGNWLIPHRAGEPYPDKPPVYMWATAVSILATSSVRLGFLLPSILAALGTLWLVVSLTDQLHGRRVAMLSGIALLSTVQFAMQARLAQIDMLVTFMITLGACGIMRHALLGPQMRWWLIGCAAMGLGVITKGVGFLPLLMIPVWIALARRGHARPLPARELLAGLGVMLAVIAAWVVPMVIWTTSSGDPELLAYRDDILLRQTAERYAASWGHLKPWHYFLVQVVPWAWLPLWLMLPWAVPNWWRRLQRGDGRTILPLSGVVLILIFFTLSPGKRGVYLLPTAPLLVLALAPLLPGLLAKSAVNRLAAGVLIFLGLLFGTGAVLGWSGFEPLRVLSEKHDASLWLWSSLLAVAMAGLLIWFRPRRGMFALAVWLAVFWTTAGLSVWPEMNDSRSPRNFMRHVAATTGPNAWLALLDFDEEFMLQTRQPTVHFGYSTPEERKARRAFAWLAAAPGERWLIVADEQRSLIDCVDHSRLHDLDFQNSQHWWLVPGPAAAGCRGDRDAAPVFLAPTSVRRSPFL